MSTNKEYSKSCAYIFYRYYSEEGIVAAKLRLGCKETRRRMEKNNRYKVKKILNKNK